MTPAEIVAAIRAVHVSTFYETDLSMVCPACKGHRWPCPPVVLADALEAACWRCEQLEEWSDSLAMHCTDSYDGDGAQEECIDRWLADVLEGVRLVLDGDDVHGKLLLRLATRDDLSGSEYDQLDAYTYAHEQTTPDVAP
jgi:hypothetical protein